MVTRDDFRKIIGPFPKYCPLDAVVIERIEHPNYFREKVAYTVEPGDRIYAYVFVPRNGHEHPAVICHHQHQDEDYFGKDEPAGLAGDPDLNLAIDLVHQGFLTFVPDALGYGERRHEEDPVGYNYWQMATRLVQGKTLLSKNIHDILRGVDYLSIRPDVESSKIGFLGHSFGGRMGVWSAAFDKRIKATVCNCGCISYRESLTEDAGIQMPFIVQGIMEVGDIEDIIKLIAPNHLLISATTDDKWSRGAQRIYESASPAFSPGGLELKLYPGGHHFTKEMKAHAYGFLRKHLS